MGFMLRLLPEKENIEKRGISMENGENGWLALTGEDARPGKGSPCRNLGTGEGIG